MKVIVCAIFAEAPAQNSNEIASTTPNEITPNTPAPHLKAPPRNDCYLPEV
jgi:hypothetical protein